jgi:hypothetical protein
MRLLACLVVLGACGGNGDHVAIDAPPHPIDAPSHPDAAIDAGPMASVGIVEVAQGTSNGSASADATAHFGRIEYGDPVGTDGPCTIYAPKADATFSAGTLSVSGTASAITLAPSGTAPNVNYSATAPVPKPAFTAGATISVTASGGPDVGAFTASVTGPQTLAGCTPSTTISLGA